MIYDDDERDAELTGFMAGAIWALACVGFGVLVGIVILRGLQ